MKLSRVILAALLACLLVRVGLADTIEVPGYPGVYISGVPTDEFVHFAAPESGGKQQMSNWCWAACIQMVLNYHGLYVTQQDIVARVYGDLVDRPAYPEQIMGALTGWAPDTRGRYSAIYADTNSVNASTVINDLHRKWPLIIGLGSPNPNEQGHAYVLTAVYYSYDGYGQPVPLRFVLRDPWPGRTSRVEMEAEEFGNRLQFAARVWVERL
ncbi:MAG: papain-like cysteine protease family protein [Candidatus Eremiobacterota bacterium]